MNAESCEPGVLPENSTLLEHCTKEQLIQQIHQLTSKVNTLLDEKQILQYQLEVQKFIIVNNSENIGDLNEHSDLINLASAQEITDFDRDTHHNNGSSNQVIQELHTDPFPSNIFEDEEKDNQCSSETRSTSPTAIEDQSLLAVTSTGLEDPLQFEDWVSRVNDIERADTDINELTQLHLEVLPYEIIPSVGEEQVVTTSADIVKEDPLTNGAINQTSKSNSDSYSEARKTSDFQCHLCPNKYKYHFSLKRHLSHQHNISSFVTSRNYRKLTEEKDKERQEPKELACADGAAGASEEKQTSSSDKSNMKKRRKKKILNLVCELCGQSFKYLYNYQRHVKKLHMENEQRLPCSMCSKVKEFPSRKSLRRHQADVHLTTPEDKHFQCHLCLELFKYHYLLQRHIARVHELKGRVSCSICSKTFATDYHLRRHLVLHQKNGIDITSLCQRKRAGANPVDVKKRPRSHGPFICEVCGKIFPKKNRLVQHSVSHAEVKPYSCNVCDKTFTRKAKLLKHQQSRHFSVYEANDLKTDLTYEAG